MKRIISVLTTLLLAAGLVSAQGGYLVKGVVEDAAGPVIGATVLDRLVEVAFNVPDTE